MSASAPALQLESRGPRSAQLRRCHRRRTFHPSGTGRLSSSPGPQWIILRPRSQAVPEPRLHAMIALRSRCPRRRTSTRRAGTTASVRASVILPRHRSVCSPVRNGRSALLLQRRAGAALLLIPPGLQVPGGLGDFRRVLRGTPSLADLVRGIHGRFLSGTLPAEPHAAARARARRWAAPGRTRGFHVNYPCSSSAAPCLLCRAVFASALP